ncbi:MAG: electron transfer flavoprotein beta subunit/FixA family protein [Actinomycetia bacterium]|nr:electron transfer flavoprotein beta subunit/FixA family protein [Actinomycetes bacterium]
MRILCCVKRVPAPGARINVTPDGQAVETAHLGFTTSPHEECAVEEAVQLADASGGTVTVLTLGPDEAEEQLRYAASVGANELVLIPTEESAWDPQRTADALTQAVVELEATGDRFDLILFGNESADAGGFQVGIRVGRSLGRPMVNGIKGVEVDGDQIVARRPVEAGSEIYRLTTPCLLGVKEGINLPRYPTMKGRLASKKVELVTLEIEADPGGQTLRLLHQPPESESHTEILGHGEDAAAAVVDLFEELGTLP